MTTPDFADAFRKDASGLFGGWCDSNDLNMPTPGDDNPVNSPYSPPEPTQSIVPSHDLNTSNDDELRFGVLISPSSVRFMCFVVLFGDKELSSS